MTTCDKCRHSRQVAAPKEVREKAKKEGKTAPDQWSCVLNPPQLVYCEWTSFVVGQTISRDPAVRPPTVHELRRVDWVHTRIRPDLVACSHFDPSKKTEVH